MVPLLIIPDHAIHGNRFKDRVGAHQQAGLPVTPHAAISIFKGVDELRIMVENTALDEFKIIIAFEIPEKVRH